MNRTSLSFRSATEVKLPRRMTLRMITPNTISIWLSHDVCFGRNTKRMRWLRSSRNFLRLSCERSTPCLPFFSQILLEVARLGYPLHQALRTVDVQVVHHQDPRGLQVRGYRLSHVQDEIGFGAGRSQRRRQQLAGDHVEVADQGQRAVTNVLELPAFRLARLHRQGDSRTLQSLNAGHFVDADRVRVRLGIQAGRLLIAVAHRLDLLLKLLRVFLAGVQPVAALVRLQLGFAEIAFHLRFRDRLDDAALGGLVGQFTRSPVRDRSARLFRRLAGQGQNLRDLLGRELARITAAWGVTQHGLNSPPKGRLALAALDQNELAPGPSPATSPHADGCLIEVDGLRDHLILLALECSQDALGRLDQTHRTGRRRDDLPKHGLLPFRDYDLGSRPWHSRPPCRRMWGTRVSWPKRSQSCQTSFDLWY